MLNISVLPPPQTRARESERDALNLIRWISAISIVICHILQAYGNILAYTFNVGVQVFFLLSGFLYGGRHITDVKKFYWGRIKKLYIPFALWCIISAILLYVSVPQKISWHVLLSQLAMWHCMSGQEHLWFMQVIFICYLLLPLVDFILTKNVPILVIMTIALFGMALHIHYTPTLIWIALYFIGYAMGRWRISIVYITFAAIAATIYFALAQGGLVLAMAEPRLIGTLTHVAFGIVIFGIFLFAAQYIKIPRLLSRAVQMPGAYEIYLVHPIFLMGPYALLALTEITTLNITLAVLAIMLTAAAFYFISKQINYKL